ncbi:MAG TPA: hypothetical protein VE758_07295 [Chthoniobacterales bacterium]|nr:hypothetical protein [Chthoniobacterales bacterium]
MATRLARVNENVFAIQVGAPVAAKIGMLVFSAANLFAGLIFGSIGFVAFVYGKRMHLWTPMLCGIALMIYPYFVNNALALWLIGVAGTGILLFL